MCIMKRFCRCYLSNSSENDSNKATRTVSVCLSELNLFVCLFVNSRNNHGRLGHPTDEERSGKSSVSASNQQREILHHRYWVSTHTHARTRRQGVRRRADVLFLQAGEVDRRLRVRRSVSEPRADARQPLGGEGQVCDPLMITHTHTSRMHTL